MSLKNLEYISISEGWGLTLVAYKKTSISSYTSKTADTLISFLEDFGEWWDGHFINILRNFTKYLYTSLTSSNLLFCTNVIKTNLFRHIQSIIKRFFAWKGNYVSQVNRNCPHNFYIAQWRHIFIYYLTITISCFDIVVLLQKRLLKIIHLKHFSSTCCH